MPNLQELHNQRGQSSRSLLQGGLQASPLAVSVLLSGYLQEKLAAEDTTLRGSTNPVSNIDGLGSDQLPVKGAAPLPTGGA